MLQLFGMMFMLVGESMFRGEDGSLPAWCVPLVENKMSSFFALYMLNVVAQNMVSTGAFEIYHNDKLIYSKMELQRMCSIEDVVHALAKNGLSITN
jgi:hypothetical protein